MKSYPRICIVDDDDVAVFGIKRGLKSIKNTSQLSIFRNGLDVLENFEELLANGSALPSLVFVDLNMPVLDGWQFMEEYTKLNISQDNAPEIYIMTSSHDHKDLVMTKKYGLERHYLVKPVTKAILQEIIR